MSLSIKTPVIYLHPPEWYRGLLWQAVTPSVLTVRDLILDYEHALRHADKYNELIMAVAKVMPGKSPHEVALHYIQRAESDEHIGGPVEAAPSMTLHDPGESDTDIGMDHKF